MIEAISHNLRNLFNFQGRDGRRTFLLYALFVIILNVLVSVAASVPTMLAAIEAGGKAAQTGDAAAVESAVLEKMIGMAEPLIWLSLAIAILNIVLLSAAFVRRAHDTGLPGLVLVIPLGLEFVWMFFAYRQLDGVKASLEAAVEAKTAGVEAAMQPGMIAQDLIGWLAVIIVLVIGSLKSQYSSNQYGSSDESQS